MDIKMKLVEWLLVSSSLILGGMCLGVYLEAGLENAFWYAMALFFLSGTVLFKNRQRKRQ